METSKEQKAEWIFKFRNHALGDTGDYYASLEITNGDICLFAESAEDIEDEEPQEICDALNNFESLKKENEELKRQAKADFKRINDLEDILEAEGLL